MCLVVIAIGQHPRYPLILAANRDEFHARPTKEAHWWPDKEGVVGGRDLQAGGTWLAANRAGRFATVTNYRDARASSPRRHSRGFLVTGFLDSDLGPHEYLDTIAEDDYAGFNLIVGTPEETAYLSNREDGSRSLRAGIYGLSNALLDGPWYKVERTKTRLAGLLESGDINEGSLLQLMDDRGRAPTDRVEAQDLDFELAHAISAPFIVTPDYGTRCTTLLLADEAGDWILNERRFDASGSAVGETRISFAAA